MKTVSVIAFFILTSIISSAGAIKCWVCYQAKSNVECKLKGHAQTCNTFEGCENEIRYFRRRITVTKRCKQLQACSTDQLQSSHRLVQGGLQQCSAKSKNSICRCCCDTDYCNRDNLLCVEKGESKCRFLFLPNGHTKCVGSLDKVSVGTRCFFQCKTGYERRGSYMVQCQRRGNIAEWSSSVAKCERKPTCMRLYGHSIRNGFVRCSGIPGLSTLGSSCVFRCNPRYFMVNENKRKTISNYEKTICTLEKASNVPKWTRKPPRCIEEMCPMFSSLLYGFVKCSDSNKLGSICNFVCSPGYQLHGKDELICKQTSAGKIWSEPLPNCQPLRCDELEDIPRVMNAKCSKQNYFGSSCTFKCRKGYYLADPNTKSPALTYSIHCILQNQKATWSNDIPLCWLKTCTELKLPDHGEVTCSNNFKVNSKCKFHCTSPIHEISDISDVTCLDNGNAGSVHGIWSAQPGMCTLKKCAMIDSLVTNANCTKGYEFGSSCSFSCKPGYFPLSSDGITLSVPQTNIRAECVLRGRNVIWSEMLPKCERKRCPRILKLRYGTFKCTDGFNGDSVCSFSCSRGFEIKGSPKAKCVIKNPTLILGKWSTAKPICKRKSCPEIFFEPRSSTVTCTNSYKYESECTVRCNAGFYMRSLKEGDITDRTTATCLARHKGLVWSNRIPSCQPKTCSKIRNINNGSQKCSEELIYLAECAFQCDAGFDLIGMNKITCEDNQEISFRGSWTGPVPICQPKQCNDLKIDQATTHMKCDRGTSFGSECYFTCLPKHFIRIDGSDQTIYTQNPKCILDEFGKNVTWQPEPVDCVPVSCKDISTSPMHASCSEGNLLGSKCTFSCPIGYDLVGNYSNVCMSNGENDATWKHPLPFCEAKSCSILVNEEQTNKTCTDFSKYGSKCSFVCQTGRGLFMTIGKKIQSSGVSVLQCAIDKRGKMFWTGDLPQCHVKFCFVLRKPKNGRMRCSNGSKFESKCQFFCYRGYKRKGPKTLLCEEGETNSPSGKWSAKVPVCTSKKMT